MAVVQPSTGEVATAIYARISEDRQDGAGVARQLGDCLSLCRRHSDWGTPREYIDNDTSAWRSGTRRPRYQSMLEAIRVGEVGRIVVYHVDRLYRQPRDLEELIDLAEQGRVEVVSVVSGEIDLRTSDGRFVARLLVSVAAKESDDKSRRIRRQKQQAREEGRWHGGRRAFGWQDGTNPDPSEARLIRKAVELLLGGDSLAAIARRWNEAGVRQATTSRSNWTADIIRQVVSNPRHAGLIGHRVETRNHRGNLVYTKPIVVGEGKWPAIIDRAQWERLQALLLQRGANGHIPRRRSLLTGLLHCSLCGSTMVRTGSSGPRRNSGRRHVWRCPSHKGCSRVSIDAAGLEELLTEVVFQAVDTQRLADLVNERDDPDGETARTMADLEELERRLDEAAESFAAGRLPARAFEHACAVLQRDLSASQRKLARLVSTAVLEPYSGRNGVLRTAWAQLSTDQRRAVIAALVDTINVRPALTHGLPRFDPDRVSIQWRA